MCSWIPFCSSPTLLQNGGRLHSNRRVLQVFVPENRVLMGFLLPRDLRHWDMRGRNRMQTCNLAREVAKKRDFVLVSLDGGNSALVIGL